MKILEDRKAIYGDFKEIAKTAQDIKKILAPAFTEDEVVNEGLGMIIHKLARIKTNPRYIENFRDIAGYCQLIIDHLEKSDNALDAQVLYKEKDSNGEWRWRNE